MAYYKRYIENKIKQALETSGVVVVAGPKFCGKTTTSELFAKSSYILDTKLKIELAQSNPESILIGENPRLIDEWQNVPDLWNQARYDVDHSENKFGKYIFTGSATPANMDEIYHSGAGRIVTIEMRPMSLYETQESSGEISLSELFNGKQKIFSAGSNLNLYDIAFYICRGGWPLSIAQPKEKALMITKNYCDTLFNFENSKNEKFRNKKKNILQMILKSYARNISTEARKSVIIKDVSEHEDRNLDRDTFDSYIEALQDLFIIKDIEAWNPNFRSKTSIISTPTRHFVDTSIATNILGINPQDLINDPRTFGLVFEDFAVKELSIYSSVLNGEIRHYRDSSGLECDAVLHLENGKYALIEIKLGGENLITEASQTLNLLKNKIKENGQKEPEFLMILTATGSAYTTSDGIHIVPITMLKA